MSIEIEAKLKVDSHDDVRTKLAAAGAALIGRVLEENHIFDSADRTLLAADRGLRVRICRNDAGQTVSTTMTYKGPRESSRFKTRPELQFGVDDPSAALEFLRALGFVEAFSFEKRRESWKMGDCRIELDDLPYLGRYVEIEGPSEPTVAAAQNAIGLGHLPHEPHSYIAMLVDYCRGRGLPATAITFAAAQSL